MDFRSLQKVDYEQRKVAHALLRFTKVSLQYIVSLGDERIWSRGRAKSVSAKHYHLNEILRMAEQYHKAWEN
jgi:hypothetical protein